jgi:hypothetical protein
MKHKKESPEKAIAVTTSAGLGAVILNELAGMGFHAHNKVLDGVHDDELSNKLLRDYPNKLTREEVPTNAHSSVAVTPEGERLIGLAKKPRAEFVAHELGHHKILDALKIRNTAPYATTTRVILPLAGLAGAGISSLKEENEKMAPWIAAGGFAPMVLDETAASLVGAKDMIKHLGFIEGFKKGLRMLPMWSTYASMPVGAFAGVKLIQHLMDKHDE